MKTLKSIKRSIKILELKMDEIDKCEIVAIKYDRLKWKVIELNKTILNLIAKHEKQNPPKERFNPKIFYRAWEKANELED